MILRTFNFWYVVAPATMVVAIVIAVASISEGATKAKKRISDRVWNRGIAWYCVIIWVLLSKLFIAESLLGMIEALGRDGENVASRAKSVWWILAAFWAAGVYVSAQFIRSRYFKYVDYACSHGRSSTDRKRRKRDEKKRREDEKEMAKRRELAANGKLCIVDFNSNGASVRRIVKKKIKKAIPAPGQNTEQEPTKEPIVEQTTPTVEQQVEAAFAKYYIEKRTNLEDVYTDKEGNGYFITKYLPEGADAYFVAINLEQPEEMPIFLGCENVEDNLRRYLTEELEKSDCSKHADAAV